MEELFELLLTALAIPLVIIRLSFHYGYWWYTNRRKELM
jgi:hypothetical protein